MTRFPDRHSVRAPASDHQVGQDEPLHDIEPVLELERRHHHAQAISHRLAEALTGFYSSLAFVLLQLVWIAAWIVLNLGWLPLHPFDPFPFSLLAVIVGIEVLLLSTFVLINQQRQVKQAEQRAKVALHVSTTAERGTTKLIEMMTEVHQALGIQRDDPQRRALAQPLRVSRVAEALEAAETDST